MSKRRKKANRRNKTKRRKKAKPQNSVLRPSRPANKQVVVEAQSASFQYSGPIPPAAELERYNQIIPNGADRIMTLAEVQSKHRQEMEKKVITGDNRRAGIGQVVAAIIVIGSLGAGTYLIVKGFDIQGLVTMLTPLSVVAGLFIRGSNQRKRERSDKDKNARK